MTRQEQFWRNVDKVAPVPPSRPDLGRCWLWTGGHFRNGYGRFGIGKTGDPTTLAHRIAYGFLRGPIEDGLELDHLCRVKSCVNPWHLEPVPHSVNNARSDSPSALNKRKDYCKRGHPLDSANTHYRMEGKTVKRSCRACARLRYWDAKGRRIAPLPVVNGEKTHCKNGHPFDAANTRFGKNRNGRPARICRICNQAWQKAQRQQRRAHVGHA